MSGDKSGKSAGNKNTIIAFAALFIVAAAGGGGYVGYTKFHDGSAQAAPTTPEADSTPADDAKYTLLKIDNLVANLAPGSRSRMVRVSLVVPVILSSSTRKNGDTEDALREAFLTHLRAVDASDLEGAAGMQRLKDALLSRAKDAIGRNAVREVLIRDFVVN